MERSPRKKSGRLQLRSGILMTLTAFSIAGAIAAYFLFMKLCEFQKSSLCKNSGPDLVDRVYSDEEVAAFAVAKEFLAHRPTNLPANSKVAFMFMTPGPLPFERLWEKFFEGHDGLYSVYVHVSEKHQFEMPRNTSVFRGREIRSRNVYWGRIEMVDAERRLLANALLDPANYYFVLLSQSCIPLFNFQYVYAYLIGSRTSFVDGFDDPGPDGRGRYLTGMQPEIQPWAWRKGSQWFAIHREHAILIVADNMFYKKFKHFCKPGMVNFNCISDEHYVQTFLHIMDPAGLANRSVTYVDWVEHKWHPKSFAIEDVTPMKLMEMQMVDMVTHVNIAKHEYTSTPCLWNGESHPCYLFARKFLPETADVLTDILPNLIQI